MYHRRNVFGRTGANSLSVKACSIPSHHCFASFGVLLNFENWCFRSLTDDPGIVCFASGMVESSDDYGIVILTHSRMNASKAICHFLIML